MIQALGNFVIVETRPFEAKTDSLIVRPDVAKELVLESTVISVGPKVKDIKPGDIVVTAKFGGSEVKHAGKEYRVFSSEDILAIL
jgi:chaperonin GroES